MTRHNLIPVADPKTAAEVIANIKATRARLAESYKRARSSMAKLDTTAERLKRIDRIMVVVEPPTPAVEIKTVETLQAEAIEKAIDQHAARDVIRIASDMSPASYLRQLCRDEGVDVEWITGNSRTDAVVKVRWKMIAAVSTRFPKLSLPELGRIFGGKDHTTVFYALRKMGLR